MFIIINNIIIIGQSIMLNFKYQNYFANLPFDLNSFYITANNFKNFIVNINFMNYFQQVKVFLSEKFDQFELLHNL